MSGEVLLSNIIPFADSGFLGYARGFCSEKDPEMDVNYHRLFGWNVLCRIDMYDGCCRFLTIPKKAINFKMK
ncbi:MAG: hypothetical protein WA364_05095 [Candidatus Nitrosopolaris sp.]